MTIDERLIFLVQSTESLHASLQEVHTLVAENSRQIAEHNKQLVQDAEAIRSLARIVEAHEHRISDLEEPPQ